jgi:hypothetical protein
MYIAEKERYSFSVLNKKGKAIPVLNKLSARPRRRFGEWMYTSTF